MALQGGACGRVGHRRTTFSKETTRKGGLFAFNGPYGSLCGHGRGLGLVTADGAG